MDIWIHWSRQIPIRDRAMESLQEDLLSFVLLLIDGFWHARPAHDRRNPCTCSLNWTFQIDIAKNLQMNKFKSCNILAH